MISFFTKTFVRSTSSSVWTSLLAVFLVCGFFTISFSAVTADSNLVANGDLEIANSSNPALPKGWVTDKWGKLTATFTYPTAGVGGSKAARVAITARTSGDAKWQFAHIPATPGAVYQVSHSYNSNVATEVDVEFRLTNGTYSYVVLGKPTTSNNTWKTFTKSVTAPQGAVSMSVTHILNKVGTLSIDNMVVTSGTSTPPPPPPPPPTKPTITSFVVNPSAITTGQSATLTWSTTDATSLSINQGVGVVTGTTTKVVSPTATTTYVLTATNSAGSVSATTTLGVTASTTPPPPPPPPPPPSDNLIKNGTLETAAGTTPQNWHADYWGNLIPKFTYPTTGKGGGKAAQVTVTQWRSGDAKWWFDHVPVSSNTVYQFSDDYNATVVSNVGVEFIRADGTYEYQWIGNAEATGGSWKTFSAQITIPTGVVSMTVLHALDKNGSLTIDNAKLTPIAKNAFTEGMVTLVFDDGLLTQYNQARPILTAAGLKATYAIITGYVGSSPYMTWQQITTLKTEGNEISSHTRTHPDLSTLSTTQAKTEIKGSYDDLVARGFTPTSMVYPYGGVNSTVESEVQSAGYTLARGSYYGFNGTSVNKLNLYDIRVDKTSTLQGIKTWIDQAKADKRWLVLELHDVVASGDELSITPALFQSIVSYLKQSGIKVVTLEEGAQQLH